MSTALNSFFPRTVLDWNNLAENIVNGSESSNNNLNYVEESQMHIDYS